MSLQIILFKEIRLKQIKILKKYIFFLVYNIYFLNFSLELFFTKKKVNYKNFENYFLGVKASEIFSSKLEETFTSCSWMSHCLSMKVLKFVIDSLII